MVVATGELQSATKKKGELAELNHSSPLTKRDTIIKYVGGKKTMVFKTIIPSSAKTKTLQFTNKTT